ncbi:MAG: T9SS type A sorting domain-containing protein [bacterium]
MKSIYLSLLVVLCAVFAYGSEFPICWGAGNQTRPDVAFDGTAYTVVYDSVGDIWGTRVDKDGNITARFVIDAHQIYSDSLPAIATDGSKCCVVWYRSGGAWPVQGAIIQGTSVTRRFDVEMSSHYRNRPAVAFSSVHDLYLIVTNTIMSPTVCGIFYDSDGYLAYSSFLIESGNQYDGFGDAMITATNNKYMVVYPKRVEDMFGNKSYYVRYALVTPPNNTQVFTLKYSQTALSPVPGNFMLYPPSVAYNGTECFCAYQFFEEDPPTTGFLNLIGARINPANGAIIENNIPIAQVTSRNEYASAIMAENECYFITWQDNRSTNLNIYGKHFDQNGDPFGGEVSVSTATNDQAIPKVAFDGLNKLVAWQDYRNGSHWDIWGYLMPKIWTDDPLAMAYNGNRHLIRKQPNNETLHLVYTDNGKIIYRWSTNGGTDWTLPVALGDGKYPAITLCPGDYTPAVAWTDDVGGLWYAKRQSELPPMWDVYHLYNPWGPYDPYLNSPPSISIVDRGGGNRWVHILVARTGRIQTNGVIHTIDDCSFPISNPGQRTFTTIEQGESEPNNPCRSNPSLVKDDWNTLHGVWQRRDTVCYALKPSVTAWNVWGWQFYNEGLQSAHPFVETYGDQVYVTWQHLHELTQKEEAFKGWRHLMSPFHRENMSWTASYVSLYPVNASGFFTVYTEEPSVSNPYEIYYKVNPIDTRYNISQTPDVTSIYSHAAARFTVFYNYLYTAWLEGDASPYQINFKKIRHSDPNDLETAYLTSISGHNPTSPYLVERDGYISDWQIPVDIGYETITYQFPLLPDYQYKLQAVAYHENSGEWREWVVIDHHPQHLIKYNAFEPETLEFWIPPAFYQDSVIEVTIERIAGGFATAGPIYVYRYEDEECGGGSGGGPMAKGSQPLNQGSLVLSPNPFTTSLQIAFQNQAEYPMSVKVYDITGRLVKNLHNGAICNTSTLRWHGDDDCGRAVSQGIYFLQVRNLDSNETTVHKVLRVR